MLAVTVACLAAAVGLWSDPGALSRMLVQPNALVALLVADVGLLVFRVVAVVDAYLLAARERPPPVRGRWRRLGAAGMVGVIGLTAAPHLASAYYDLQAYDLITSVFTGADPGWKASGRGGGANGVATALPGRVTVPEAACAISAESLPVPPGRSAGTVWPLVGRGPRVVVEANQLTSPLLVRSRRPGDAFRPLGLRGRKKLQDFFVDEKVQRCVRDTVPLVVDSLGRIVWVAGHVLAEDFRVTDRTEAVIILKQEPI